MCCKRRPRAGANQSASRDPLGSRSLPTQRAAFKAGTLQPTRQERLDAIGMQWGLLRAPWERNYALLSAYSEREGNADVPQGHVENVCK